MRYHKARVSLNMAQVRKLLGGRAVRIHHRHLQGGHTLKLTTDQMEGMGMAHARGCGTTLRMTHKQILHNIKGGTILSKVISGLKSGARYLGSKIKEHGIPFLKNTVAPWAINKGKEYLMKKLSGTGRHRGGSMRKTAQADMVNLVGRPRSMSSGLPVGAYAGEGRHHRRSRSRGGTIMGMGRRRRPHSMPVGGSHRRSRSGRGAWDVFKKMFTQLIPSKDEMKRAGDFLANPRTGNSLVDKALTAAANTTIPSLAMKGLNAAVGNGHRHSRRSKSMGGGSRRRHRSMSVGAGSRRSRRSRSGTGRKHRSMSVGTGSRRSRRSRSGMGRKRKHRSKRSRSGTRRKHRSHKTLGVGLFPSGYRGRGRKHRRSSSRGVGLFPSGGRGLFP